MHASNRYRSRSPRPPPLPQSPRPTISVTKPKSKNISSSNLNGPTTPRTPRPSRPSSPEFPARSPALRRPPPVPRSPRPVLSPALKKSSRNDHSQWTSSPVMKEEHIPEDQIAIALSPSDDSLYTGNKRESEIKRTRLQDLVQGLGLGVQLPNHDIPQTPSFDYSPPLKQSNSNMRRISTSPNMTPYIVPSSPYTSPYADIGSQIDRMSDELVRSRHSIGDSYVAMAKQTIRNTKTPPDPDHNSDLSPPEDYGIPPTDSDLSSLGEAKFNTQNDPEEFTVGAAKLIREVSLKSTNSSVAPSSYSSDPASKDSSSGFSQYHHRSIHDNAQDSARNHLLSALHASETYFTNTLRKALSLFVLPLRLRSLSHSPNLLVPSSSPGWIDGLPAPIGRLFDWLEDIVVIHERLLRDMEGIDVDEALMDFSGRLEVYQGYLIRSESVIELVEELIDEPDNDFGEFVRMQGKDPACGGRTLPYFLRMPITRLAEYPEVFKSLLDVTRHTHPSYISILSLYFSCTNTIDVMNEVKRREEEHEFLKNIEKRVIGLEETGWKLARRERRLIAQGLLKLVDDPDIESSNTLKRPMTPGASYGNSNSKAGSKEWDAASTSSSDWISSESSAFASATHFTPHPSPRRRAHSLTHLREKHSHGKDETSVYAFVFTDVMLLTLPSGGSTPEELELLRGIGVSKVLTVVDLSGQTNHDHLIRLDIIPLLSSPSSPSSSPPGGPPHQVHRIYLSLTERMTPRMSLAPSSLIHEARRKWFAAFKQCNMHALRTLVYPEGAEDEREDFEEALKGVRNAGLPMPKSPSQQMISQMQQNQMQGHQNHGQGQKYGMQGPGQGMGMSVGMVNGEREERGWWSLRFQMMMREMRRAQAVGASGVSGGRLGIATNVSTEAQGRAERGHSKERRTKSQLPVPGYGSHGSRRGASVSPSAASSGRRKG